MKCSAEVAEYKRANNMPVLDKKRETEILNAKMQAAEEGFGAAVYDFYTAIMAISRAAQNERLAKKDAKIDISGFERSFKSDPTVVFQGAAGANSESALINIFGEDCKRKNAMTFAEVLDMVENGESMFIWDWFYGFETPIDEIAGFAVTVESETSSYTEYQKIDAQGMMMDSIAYALVENTLDTDIYGVSAVIAVDDDEGRLLDVCRVSTGNATGIFPGSTMILRATVRDYENDTTLESGNATVYALHELD